MGCGSKCSRGEGEVEMGKVLGFRLSFPDILNISILSLVALLSALASHCVWSCSASYYQT